MEKTEKTNKRRTWTNSETRLFLSCYKVRKEEFHSRKKRFGYERVLKDMISLGFEDVCMESKSLEGKMRTLLQTYKSAKDSARQSGSECHAPFMAELDDIFCQKSIERNGPKVTIEETVYIPGGKGTLGTKTCRLCIKNSNDYKSLFDTTGRANTVYSTTIKYFDPMQFKLTQEYLHQQIVMCLQCWIRICEFDSFKYSVLEAQNTLSSQIKPTLDDGNKLERYFGKQDGCDPLDVCVSVKNEATVDEEMDESEDSNYFGDDMSNDDVMQDDETGLDLETTDHHLGDDNEDSIQSADINDENSEEECIPVPEPKVVEPSISKNRKSLTTTNANTKPDGKFVKLISKYRLPVDKAIDVNSSSKNCISWSSNRSQENTSLGDGNENVSNCDDNPFIYFNESDTDLSDLSIDELDEHMSTIHTPMPEFVCNGCGITASSPEILRNHVCSARSTKRLPK